MSTIQDEIKSSQEKIKIEEKRIKDMQAALGLGFVNLIDYDRYCEAKTRLEHHEKSVTTCKDDLRKILEAVQKQQKPKVDTIKIPDFGNMPWSDKLLYIRRAMAMGYSATANMKDPSYLQANDVIKTIHTAHNVVMIRKYGCPHCGNKMTEQNAYQFYCNTHGCSGGHDYSKSNFMNYSIDCDRLMDV